MPQTDQSSSEIGMLFAPAELAKNSNLGGVELNASGLLPTVTPADKLDSASDKVTSISSDAKDNEPKLLEMFDRKDLVSYLGAVIYGYWENMRAMGFDSPGVIDSHEPGEFVRATEGIRKLFDQNTGDGTIVALGFLGAEALSLSVDKIAKKLGKKGFDPKIRFLSSLTFGIGLASYLETTHIMNNTIDMPGDLFGVGLGAAFILTSKLAADHVTAENITKLSEKTKQFIETAPAKFQAFSKTIASKLGSQETADDNSSTAESITQRFVELVEQSEGENENINPSL